MRLIGLLENEKQAFLFYAFLLKGGIKSTYEPIIDPVTQKEVQRIWVYEEDDLAQAMQWLEEFKQDPTNPKFAANHLVLPPVPPEELLTSVKTESEERSPSREFQIKLTLKRAPMKGAFALTYFIILLCGFLFVWNSGEQMQMIEKSGKLFAELSATPLQAKLMFDYPLAKQKLGELLSQYHLSSMEDLNKLPASEKEKFNEVEKIPEWKGVLPLLFPSAKEPPHEKAPLFEKIRQGEIWRLFTPCLLHFGFFHILFNMAWAWLLCKQIEARINRIKMILLILLIGIISNVSQYLVSGPYFVGFSGVITGLVGFIWMRQKIAPWEGYPLQTMTVVFILVFVGAMLLLEIFTLLVQVFSSSELTAAIANTAHIVGGLIGMLLGRTRLFARGET